MRLTFDALLAVAAALSAAQPSYAAFDNMGGAASLGPIMVELVDMDAFDGVSPWITFIASDTRNTLAHVSATTRWGGEQRLLDSGSTPWAPVSAHVTAARPNRFASSNAVLSNSTDSFAHGATLDASGLGGYTGGYSDRVRYWADVDAFGQFLVSANTKVTFLAAGSVSAFLTAGPRTWAWSDASVRVDLFGVGADGNGTQRSSDYLSVGFHVFHPAGGMSDSASKDQSLQASFINLTDADMSGVYSSNARVDAQVAVPEPATYLLLLTGLWILGHASRRPT